jgi:hypothetical protein
MVTTCCAAARRAGPSGALEARLFDIRPVVPVGPLDGYIVVPCST